MDGFWITTPFYTTPQGKIQKWVLQTGDREKINLILTWGATGGPDTETWLELSE